MSALLPADDSRLSPAKLLARIDRATTSDADHQADRQATADQAGAGGPVRPAAALAVHRPASVTASTAAPATASESSAPAAPDAPHETAPAPASDSAPADADDAALVAFLHRHAAARNAGEPLAIREVQRLISSGWSKAKRIHALTDWTDAEPDENHDSQPRQERQLQLLTSSSDSDSNESQTEHQESRA